MDYFLNWFVKKHEIKLFTKIETEDIEQLKLKRNNLEYLINKNNNDEIDQEYVTIDKYYRTLLPYQQSKLYKEMLVSKENIRFNLIPKIMIEITNKKIENINNELIGAYAEEYNELKIPLYIQARVFINHLCDNINSLLRKNEMHWIGIDSLEKIELNYCYKTIKKIIDHNKEKIVDNILIQYYKLTKKEKGRMELVA